MLELAEFGSHAEERSVSATRQSDFRHCYWTATLQSA